MTARNQALVVLVFSLGVLAGVLCQSTGSAAPAQALRAGEFLLEGVDGKTAGALRLSEDGRPEFVLYDSQGVARVQLSIEPTGNENLRTEIHDKAYFEEWRRNVSSQVGGVLTFHDGNGAERVRVGEFPQERGIEIRDVFGRPRLEAKSHWILGSPFIQLKGSDGEQDVLVESEFGNGRLVIVSSDPEDAMKIVKD